MNARRHGLSSAPQTDTQVHLQGRLVQLIGQDGIDEVRAQEIASRLLDYERNLAHQRDLMVRSAGQTQSQAVVQEELRRLFGRELDLFADELDEQLALRGQVKRSSANMAQRVHQRLLAFTVKVIERRELDAAKAATNSVRYLKRASNQLIKSLKGLRTA
ncbi:hypothetical protein [Rheinheimera sp.]|uniref:hypothetical protein n=1 Tax=Rheinheimera sp. TaxID=1869214 RepID=UPI004047922D